MSSIPPDVEQASYIPAMKPELLSLLHAAPYKAVLWEWQFEQSPFGKPFEPIIFTEHGRIIGFNGVMPIRIQYLGVEQDALWSCDFYIDERFRGQGLGKRIKQELLTHAAIIMSFGVSPDAARVLSKMGWRLSEHVYTYRRMVHAKSVREWGLRALQYVNRLRGLNGTRFTGGNIQCLSHLPDKVLVDALWGDVRGHYAKTVVRNHAYLYWKYQQHPLASYQYWCAKDNQGRLLAVLVTRIHASVVRVVDYAGPSVAYEMKRAMISCVILNYPDNALIMTTSDPELGNAVCHLGGFRARTQPLFFVHSAVEGDSDTTADWFIMSGDSDGEILTAASENFCSVSE